MLSGIQPQALMASFSYTNSLLEVTTETTRLPLESEAKFEGLDLYGWEFKLLYNSSGYRELLADHPDLGQIRQLLPLAHSRVPDKFAEVVDRAWAVTNR